MTRELRGVAILVACLIAVLLQGLFATAWLDDASWEISRSDIPVLSEASGLLAMKIMLVSSGALLLLAMVFAVVSLLTADAWPATISQILLTFAIVVTVGQVAYFAFGASASDRQRLGGPGLVDQIEARVPPPADQEKIAEAYAPRVLLHENDRFRPIDPNLFVKRSTLLWRRANGQASEIEPRGAIDPAALGRLCDESLHGCYGAAGYLAREVTRPHHSRGRPVGLSPERGFVLDPPKSIWTGAKSDPPRTPVFYEFRRSVSGRLHLAYWFFYAYSRPNVDGSEDDKGDVHHSYSHEGDWENVEVVFDADDGTPVEVLFYAHGSAPARLPWTQVCKVDVDDCSSPDPGHPIVYSARKSHASYHTAGRWPLEKIFSADVVDVTSRAGIEWDSWGASGRLRPATEQPWYGYGGAWGGATAIPSTTGPLGPGRHKLPLLP
ncbi:MAG: hypothetical protein M3N56_10470 [Actinomycetota bacterium]|nr:hypothetical protein [Actinomycetota bacterium]